jgi:hypothetical protein
MRPSFHVLRMSSHDALAILNGRYGSSDVRIWFAAGGVLVGTWRDRRGRTNAIGHDGRGRTIAYRVSPPADNWGRR